MPQAWRPAGDEIFPGPTRPFLNTSTRGLKVDVLVIELT